MSWQDWVISGSQVGFLLALIPAIRDENVEIPRKTSVPTCAFLLANAIAFSTMGIPLSTVTAFLGAAGWATIAGLRAPSREA